MQKSDTSQQPRALQSSMQHISVQHTLRLMLTLLLFLSGPVQASFFGNNSLSEQALSEPVSFLKVDDAFKYETKSVSGGQSFHWKIAPEYYLYRGRIKFKSLDGNATFGAPKFSDEGIAKTDPYFGEVRVIHNELEIFLPITLKDGISDTEIQVSYQGCAEAGLCYPPRKQTELYVPTAQGLPVTSAEPNTNTSKGSSYNLDSANDVFSFMGQASLASIALIFFLLGLGLTFTPCVFPMIPIITSIIAGQDQSKTSMSRNFVLALAYVLGMAITYAAAGTITGLLGASANIQATLQNPYVLSLFAAIFAVLSLSMFGFYELQLPDKLRNRLNAKNQNLHGGYLVSVFIMGALSALVVSPCVSAPLAGALIYISTTGDAILGGLALFTMGLGMGVPLIIVALGGAKYLPKSGAWLNISKAIFGIMFLAVAIWLLARFLPGQISMILWGILVLVCGVHMGAFEAASKGWARTFKAAGLIFVIIGALILVGAFSGATNPLAPLENNAAPFASGDSNKASKPELPFNVVRSITELEAEFLEAKTSNKTLLVDFYADWCISCIVMANEVFPQPNIHKLMSQIHLVKADVSANSDANIALMQKYGVFGPPSFLFFDQQGSELKQLRVMGEVTAEDFEKRLNILVTDL